MSAYWRAVLQRLTTTACGRDELAELAREQIAKSIFGLVQVGLISQLEQTVRSVVGSYGQYWPEALQNVRSACAGGTREESQRLREQLEPVIKLLTPNSFPERLRLIVSIPGHDLEKDESSGSFVDLSEREAIGFAQDCARDPSELLRHLPVILEGEQRKAYPFGLELGEQAADPATLIDGILDALRGLPANKFLLRKATF